MRSRPAVNIAPTPAAALRGVPCCACGTASSRRITIAADYFNAVLESRGLVALDDRIPAESLTIEKITQERYKEFVGEGQTFFNMKRLNLDIQAITGEILPAANSIYTVPVPEEEFNYRNEVYDVKQ